MAKFGIERPKNGTLSVSVDSSGTVTTVFFVPAPAALAAARKPNDTPPTRLAEIDASAATVRIYPINTLVPSSKFLESKYLQVRCFEIPLPVECIDYTLSDFEYILEALPRGFTKDYQFGLGLPKEYRFIVEMIEDLTKCTEIVLSVAGPTRVDGHRFAFASADFEILRAELDRITSRAQAAASRVKRGHIHNTIAPYVGVDPVTISRGRHPITQLITDNAAGITKLDAAQQDELVEAAIRESSTLASERPEVLSKLRNDIELVSLDVLIDAFTSALGRSTSEPYWQQFFQENPFALHLAFGYPVIRIQDQASVGGMRLSGRGEKIADFLVKNSLTNNVALFEIKKPSSPLLRKKQYREGVFGPSRELVDSVNQVLDQKYQLEKSLVAIKDNTRNPDLESYSVRCCLIVGTAPEDPDLSKSFELYRQNSKNVDIIAYDELLEKLKQLRDLLRGEPADDGSDGKPEDVDDPYLEADSLAQL